MKIRDRFTNLEEELYLMLERVNEINEPKIIKVNKKQAENVKKYWNEIHYLLSEKKMELVFNEDFTKLKIIKND